MFVFLVPLKRKCLETTVIDFEVAIIGSIKVLFPAANTSSCNYHFNQCLWRKVQEFGLVPEYKENEEARLHIRMCPALAQVPLNMIDECLLYTQESTPEKI